MTAAIPLSVLILGIALILLVRAALNPWVLFLGGDFHPLGYWSGWGRMHSRTANRRSHHVNATSIVFGDCALLVLGSFGMAQRKAMLERAKDRAAIEQTVEKFLNA